VIENKKILQFMIQEIALEEMTIIVIVKNYNPSWLTLDFLSDSGIIPSHWELANPPLMTSHESQFSFCNGINIVAQTGAIIFAESLNTKTLINLKIPETALKYVQILPNANYQAVSINPRSFITFPNADLNAAHRYFTNTFLASASWNKTDSALLKASLNLTYSLEMCPLHLNISEVQLQLANTSPQPAILFSGNFPYELTGENPSQRLEQLHQYIDRWREDLDTFNSLIYDKFLNLAVDEISK
jgi:hypothetical protein